jgi:hypothetical protein
MNTSLRLIFTSSLLALPLVACGDDGKGAASDSAQTTENDPSTSSTTDTTETPTSSSTADPGTTLPEPGTTTGPEPGTTQPDPDPDPETTTDPGTTTDDDTTTTTTAGALSWESDVFPAVLAGNCGCHGNGAGGLTLGNNAGTAYDALVDVDSSQAPGFKRVAPGDPGASYLIAKLKGVAGEAPFNGNNPSQMPKGGAPLPDAAIATLEQWISEGAQP